MEDALHDYQREGVDFLVDHPLGMLGDDPGLGKSAQAIRAAIEADVSEAFILCPAIARVSWEKEIRKWDPARMIRWRVASYDSVGLAANRDGRKELRERMATARRSALILDEAHYLKSPGANRTKAVYGKGGLAEHAKLVWSLSGTFAPNHAGELYPHLKFRGIFAGTKTEFEDQFCKVRDTPFGRQIVGSKNLDKLRELLAPVFLKRRKADDADIQKHSQYLISRGAATSEFDIVDSVSKLNPVFATRLSKALQAAEAATGEKAKITDGYRDIERQKKYHDAYLAGSGGLAAAAGRSGHQRGNAADMSSGKVLNWLH